MALATLLNQPATIIRRGPSADTDEFGNEIPGEETVEVLCEIQQRQRREDENVEEIAEGDWLGIFPAGTDLRTGDAVEVDGVTYELVGDPWPARNPRTQAESHVEATLRRTAGSLDAS